MTDRELIRDTLVLYTALHWAETLGKDHRIEAICERLAENRARLAKLCYFDTDEEALKERLS